MPKPRQSKPDLAKLPVRLGGTKVPRKFEWTGQRLTAAQMVADGVMTIVQIAQAVGMSVDGLHKLKDKPVFIAEVEKIRRETAKALRAKGILVKANRLNYLNERHLKLLSIIDARAAAPPPTSSGYRDDDGRWIKDEEDVPGWDSGLLVHDVKGVGKGADFQLVDTYKVDTGLLAEIRAIERQAAEELGEWVQKGELSGPNGTPLFGVSLMDLVKYASRPDNAGTAISDRGQVVIEGTGRLVS